MRDPLEYVDGERAAAEVLAYIAVDAAAPNELHEAVSRLHSDSARAGFCRAIQKRLEQLHRAPA